VSPLTGDREFESISLHRRVWCEPDFLDHNASRRSSADPASIRPQRSVRARGSV